ncbi:hypothetical protein [Undibacterium sp.]|jgi:hypothetical protein|uniref:hypothetical protein n=1 Tax=Undibacterium sp. TaxID=1914977 RepID=UPI002C3E5400|nr:hypothetical protein [Undibacterium sp.]HTD04115.1 hypothetical protein [Undibacterium sp.]
MRFQRLLLAIAGITVTSLASAQLTMSTWKPQMTPIATAEIERVGQSSGLADCFWLATVSPKTFNILIPDSAVMYWVAQYRLPPGATLHLRGQYPFARHMSFNSYNAGGMPVDRINDVMVQAEGQAANPYQAGAVRQGVKRDYLVNVVAGSDQQMKNADGLRPANTLFTESDSGVHQLWYRVYVPDHGMDSKGGVSLPAPVMTMADGQTISGDQLCKQMVVKDAALRDIRLPTETVRQMYAIPGAGSPVHPAQNPPRWNAFFNPALSVTNVLIGTPYEGMRDKQDPTRRGGFYSTLDNTYMSAYIDNRLGQVLVLRAKAPTTPRTYRNAVTMPAAQLRYWSICKYRSLADTAVDACLYDEQVPVDQQGYYTIAVSKADVRPANASDACGVAWLDWGSAGDGIGNPSGGFLAYRHMMPSPDFYPHSLFATKKPGDEMDVLGEYFPKANYMSRADFEKLGCRSGS